jgi:hypothetical protein
MDYSDMQPIVDELLTFPVAHAAVIDQVGALTISSPSGDSVTVREVLDPVEVDGYTSAEELYTAIVGNLDDSFIGRKYYDDRGGNPMPVGDGDFEVSF